MNPENQVSDKMLKILCWIVLFWGILLRFHDITQSSFIFYDEGMYLNHNRELLLKIREFPPQNTQDFFAIIKILFNSALTTAKWLWFYISNLRVFAPGPDAIYMTRFVSALCGVMTIAATYVYCRRAYRCESIALLAAAVLAVLPSHVFYSRLAMQESMGALCFILGIIFYQSRRKWCWFLAPVFFSAVFFVNYRMIILPVLLAVLEWITGLKERRALNWQRWLAVTVMFLGIIFYFGNLNGGSNRMITTAWMMRQGELAGQSWHFLNVFSYFCQMFWLEGWLLGGIFFMSVLWAVKRKWDLFLPATLVFAQMLIFTFAADKGARYLCVVLPFAAIAVALNLQNFFISSIRYKRGVVQLLLLVFFLALAGKSAAVAQSPMGYKHAADVIQRQDPQAKILTTQPLVMNLFWQDSSSVQAAPKTFQELIVRYEQGYRYLILDPQAYISWTSSGSRFTTPLVDYLGFVFEKLPPIVRLKHLNSDLLDRFVFDHNEHLMNSMLFLNRRDSDFGAVYIYDLTQCLQVMKRVVQSVQHKSLETSGENGIKNDRKK